jgi:hypothetical protein
MLQLLIHLVSFSLESCDFKFSWSNISLKILNLVIKYELELFKLLSLLLEHNKAVQTIQDKHKTTMEGQIAQTDQLKREIDLP